MKLPQLPTSDLTSIQFNPLWGDTVPCLKGFAGAFGDLKNAGYVVLGVSSDSSETHAAFAAENELPFQLLADEGDEVRALYGIPKDLGLLKGRETFIIGKDGVVTDTFNGQFAVEKHVEMALASC